jgi:hypothetical protein
MATSNTNILMTLLTVTVSEMLVKLHKFFHLEVMIIYFCLFDTLVSVYKLFILIIMSPSSVLIAQPHIMYNSMINLDFVLYLWRNVYKHLVQPLLLRPLEVYWASL